MVKRKEKKHKEKKERSKMFGQKRRRKKQGSIIEKKHVANARRYITKKNGRYRGPWMSE